MTWWRWNGTRPATSRANVCGAAIVVVHESGSNMAVGRLFARSLRAYGLHTFLIHLPYYGERATAGRDWDRVDFLPTMRQAVADVRRARDAAAGLPDVEPGRIGLQGTSLGGFVAALAGSLDGRFSAVFIMLAGGNLDDLVANGRQDTAKSAGQPRPGRVHRREAETAPLGTRTDPHRAPPGPAQHVAVHGQPRSGRSAFQRRAPGARRPTRRRAPRPTSRRPLLGHHPLPHDPGKDGGPVPPPRPARP